MLSLRAIIISSNLDNVKTGGEIINAHVYNYFKEKSRDSQIIQLKDVPASFRKSLLLSMLWFLFKLRSARNSIIIESQGLATRLFLLNLHLRLFNKGNKIVSYVFHLSKHNKKHSLSWFDALAEKTMLKASHKVICLSESTKQDIVLEGLSPSKISAIPPGTELAPERKERFWSNKQVRLLFAGNVVPRKGLIYLVEALSLLKKADFVLDVVGRADKDLEYFNAVKQTIKDKGLEDRIVFRGWRNRQEMKEFYSQADLFVFPSLWEGFGMVLLEAMVFGLPVISTRMSAIPELIEHGKNGLLVGPKNTVELAEAITKLIHSPNLRKKISLNNYRKAYSDYSWETIGEKFYNEVVSCCQ